MEDKPYTQKRQRASDTRTNCVGKGCRIPNLKEKLNRLDVARMLNKSLIYGLGQIMDCWNYGQQTVFMVSNFSFRQVINFNRTSFYFVIPKMLPNTLLLSL